MYISCIIIAHVIDKEMVSIRARIVYLGQIGKRLDGPAIGKLLAKFFENCEKEGFVPIVDCSGVTYIGKGVTNAMKLYPKPKLLVLANANPKVKKAFD